MDTTDEFEDDPIIYAQIKRETNSNNNSKLIKFFETLPRFQSGLPSSSLSTNINQSHRKTVRIGYNLDLRSNKLPDWFQLDSEHKCLSIIQQKQQNQTNQSSNQSIKLIPYDHIFIGSLPEKLLSIPITILTEPIQLLAYGHLNNAVIITIDDLIDPLMIINNNNNDDCCISNINQQKPTNLINEFQQFVHRGLMIHSIAWLFDAINHHHHNSDDNDECLNPNTNRAYIQLSASILFHHKIYDLIANRSSSSSSSQSTLVAVDQEIEYECNDARHAVSHLEHAFNLLEQIHSTTNKQKNEYLFVLTIHLYRFQLIPLLNTNKKCQAIENHSKLYLIDIPLSSSSSSSTSQLYQIMTRLFKHDNLTSFSKSKMANLLIKALSNNDQHQPETSLTILANLKPNLHRPETILERCQLISLMKKWPLKQFKNDKHHHHRQQQQQSSCKSCLRQSNNNVKNPKDVDSCQQPNQNYGSSSELSFDTVISRNHHHHHPIQSSLNISHDDDGSGIENNNQKCFAGNLNEHMNKCRKTNCDCCCYENHHRHHHHRHNQSQSKRSKLAKNSNSSHESLNKQLKRNDGKDNNHYHHHRKQLAKRIRQRKRSLLLNESNDDSIWSEELWIDGPNINENSTMGQTTTTTTNQQCLHSLNEKKKHRIEQWISTTYHHRNNNNTTNISIDEFIDSTNRMLDLGFKCLDDNCFAQCNQQQNIVVDDDPMICRDTLSDCGDKKSDFYDEYYNLWKLSPKNARKKSQRQSYRKFKDANDNDGNNQIPKSNELPQPPPASSTTTTTLSTMFNRIAEPPKQLKLEQFLQQLSKITVSSLSKDHHHHHSQTKCESKCSFENCHCQLESQMKLQSQQQPLQQQQKSSLKSYGLNKINRDADQATINHRPSCSPTGSKNSINSSQQKQPIIMNKHEFEQKMKRNTTSTTTSGHGTISEGECSSIAKKTSSVSTPSYGSNGIVGDNNSSSAVVVVDNSVGVHIVQRQPASSGYESTVQDDDDVDDDDEENDDDYLYNDHQHYHHHYHHQQQQQNRQIKCPNKLAPKSSMTVLTTKSGSIKTMMAISANHENDENLNDEDDQSLFCSMFCCGH
ncbi:uncharacterized protein LOC113794164 isoform X2 [Dermatophagoides pteronyssinus]